MTERMITAIEHPLVRAIGHPTGRLIERRAPYAIDLDAVFAAAAASGTLLEINANPDRRDLSESPARAARPRGVMLVIDSDAHRTARSRTCAGAWPPRGAHGCARRTSPTPARCPELPLRNGRAGAAVAARDEPVDARQARYGASACAGAGPAIVAQRHPPARHAERRPPGPR